MAINLNLLPPEYSLKKGFGRILKTTRSLTIILLVACLLLGVSLAIFLFVSFLSLGQISSNVEELKNQIKAEETTEQRLTLLKDRISKIKSVNKEATIVKSLDQIEPIISTTSGLNLSELAITQDKIETSISFAEVTGITDFFESLTSSSSFSSIVMTSFGFNPITGYLTNLTFREK